MLTLNDVEEIRVDVTTDKSLPAYSHSMLNAISTCPTYGLVTYVGNKAIGQSTKRAMALEAGSASHEAYAAARLFQVMEYQGLEAHAAHHGVRLFGEDRYESMLTVMADAGDDMRLRMLKFCLEAFYTSGFYDDPSDKRRTFVNIEEALIAYLDRFDFRRNVWIEDMSNAQSRVGIEIPIDITVTYVMKNGDYPDLQLRFIGTADGVSVEKDGKTLRLEENKTASRLGEAWAMAWHTSHQQTGYMIGLSCALGHSITKAAVHGMCIPLPRSYDAGGLMTEIVRRNGQQYTDFIAWVFHCAQMIKLHGDDPVNAPKYTGNCNKYFRACSLVPLCASDAESRNEMWDMMVDRELSPTEEALADEQ